MRAAYTGGLALCAVLLAACFASQAGQLADDPDAPWIPGLPIANSFAGIVDVNSDPSGAEAITSLGGSCRTPCSLEVTAEGPFTVSFSHEGHESTTVEVKIQHARMGVSERKFAPNPVFAHLAPVAVAPPPAPPKKTVTAAPPPQASPKKPTAAASQPAARHAPAQPARPVEAKPTAALNSGPIVVPADAARSMAQPPQAEPSKPAAAAPPTAPAAAAPPAWPVEVKPIPGGPLIVPQRAARPAPAQPVPAEMKPTAGTNSGPPSAPADAARSSDNPVARRWLENFDKPAADQAPDQKTNPCRGC